MIFFNRQKEKELDHNIKIYYNIFSKKERKDLLDQLKPFLIDLGEKFPGLQSPPEIHYVYRTMELFDPTIKICERIGVDNKKVDRMWGNFSNNKIKSPTWHNHKDPKDDKKLSAVYMIENPDKVGTIFKIDGEEYSFKTPTNSLIVFPSYYTHTAPLTKSDRYTLAMDISS